MGELEWRCTFLLGESSAINSSTIKDMIDSFENIFTYERLLRSFNECKKGQLWKGNVIDFNANYVEKITKLEQSILDGTYEPFPDNINYIHERGKTRKIHSQHIRDRIVHKVVNQDILIPTFHKRFIRYNSASQKQKGVDFAMKSFKMHLNRAYRKWGTDFYILSIDIRKYFENIPHDYIEKLLRKEIKDERIIRLCMSSMKSYDGGKGLGLGSEINQTYALLCLNEFDHIMKERFHIKEYARYMDDIYIIHNDKEFLHEIIEFAKSYLSGLRLEMNEKKTNIIPIKNGITFLGFRWKLTKTGHVMLVPKKQTIFRNKKKLRKLKLKLDSGVFTFEEIQNSRASMLGNLGRSNCHKVITNMDNYFNKIFIESQVFDNE